MNFYEERKVPIPKNPKSCCSSCYHTMHYRSDSGRVLKKCLFFILFTLCHKKPGAGI